MDVHPTKNGIFIGIDPYPYWYDSEIPQITYFIAEQLWPTSSRWRFALVRWSNRAKTTCLKVKSANLPWPGAACSPFSEIPTFCLSFQSLVIFKFAPTKPPPWPKPNANHTGTGHGAPGGWVGAAKLQSLSDSMSPPVFHSQRSNFGDEDKKPPAQRTGISWALGQCHFCVPVQPHCWPRTSSRCLRLTVLGPKILPARSRSTVFWPLKSLGSACLAGTQSRPASGHSASIEARPWGSDGSGVPRRPCPGKKWVKASSILIVP